MSFENLCRTTAALLLLAALPGTAAAADTPSTPTLDQVVARYTAARGGAERWAAARSLALSGTYTTFSVDAPFTMERRRPDLYRFESTYLKLPFTIGHDAGGSWWIFPIYGVEWAQRTAPPDAGMIARDSDFEPALLGWKEKGHTAELTGRGDVDGEETLVVKLTRKDGTVETWHLDPQTGLEVAVDSTVWDFTQKSDPMPQRAYFSDFRTVDGLVLPFRIEREFGARLAVFAIDKVTVGRGPDQPADQSAALAKFRFPLPAGMEDLRSLAGSWDLTIETPAGPPPTPWQAVKTVSTITPLFDGALLEERYATEQDGVRSEVVHTASFDRFASRYRLTRFDGTTAHLNVFEGTLADGKLTADNVTTNTARKEGGNTVHERQVFHDLGPAGFKVDWERSTDAGKTWEPSARHTYVRSQ
jgi:hypothetical protein